MSPTTNGGEPAVSTLLLILPFSTNDVTHEATYRSADVSYILQWPCPLVPCKFVAFHVRSGEQQYLNTVRLPANVLHQTNEWIRHECEKSSSDEGVHAVIVLSAVYY